MVATVAGLLGMLMFLFFGAQLMIGLYATSTLRAVVHDAAARAASQDGARRADLEGLARQAEGSMGGMAEHTTIELELVDSDADGIADVVVGRGIAIPPRFVPPTLGGMLGFEEIRAGAQVRIERTR